VNLSPVVIVGSTMHILAKRCILVLTLVLGSNEYVHLEHDLITQPSITYQKQNYNSRVPLLLDGLTAHGFTIDNFDLKFVIASNKDSNELFVLNQLQGNLRVNNGSPHNMDYQYYISEKKKVPKSARYARKWVCRNKEVIWSGG
jgi:hypothetical protein